MIVSALVTLNVQACEQSQAVKLVMVLMVMTQMCRILQVKSLHISKSNSSHLNPNSEKIPWWMQSRQIEAKTESHRLALFSANWSTRKQRTTPKSAHC